MLTEDYNFEVPEHLIAQHPAAHRSDSKMLVYYRDTKKIEDRMFRELPEILNDKYHRCRGNCLPSGFLSRKEYSGINNDFVQPDQRNGQGYRSLFRIGRDPDQ